MFRKLLILANIITFLCVQTTWALPKTEISAINEYLKLTEMTRREVPMKEFYNKISYALPKEMKEQFELFIKENPNLKMPKIDVKKIMVNGQEELQFSVNSSEGSVIITTQSPPRNPFYVVGKLNGDEIRMEIGYDFFLYGHQFMYEGRKTFAAKNLKLIPPSQLGKFSIGFQKRYIKKVRELLIAAEDVQRAVYNSKNKKTSANFFIKNLFGQEANAASSNGCIVAGWVNGTWQGNQTLQNRRGYCLPDQAIKKDGTVQCNPDIFGEGIYVDFKTDDDRKNATFNCSQKDPQLKNYVEYRKKNKPATDKYDMAFIEAMKHPVEGVCDSDSNVSDDQKNTCGVYKTRIAEIGKLGCDHEAIKADADFAQACNQVQAPVAAPSPQPALPGKDNPSGPGADGSVVSDKEKECVEPKGTDDTNNLCNDLKYAKQENMLDTSHCSGTSRSVVCNGISYSYCYKCDAGFERGTYVQDPNNHALAFINCKAKGDSASSHEECKYQSYGLEKDSGTYRFRVCETVAGTSQNGKGVETGKAEETEHEKKHVTVDDSPFKHEGFFGKMWSSLGKWLKTPTFWFGLAAVGFVIYSIIDQWRVDKKNERMYAQMQSIYQQQMNPYVPPMTTTGSGHCVAGYTCILPPSSYGSQ